MSDGIADGIRDGKGNYLSTEYWALSTEPVLQVASPNPDVRQAAMR